MDYLKTHDSITSSGVMEVLSLKASPETQILREMVERNLLEAQGKNRNRYYDMSTEEPYLKITAILTNQLILTPCSQTVGLNII